MITQLRTLTRATAFAAAGAVLCAGAAVAATTNSLTSFGDVLNPGVYDLQRLESFPTQIRTIGTDVYTGASLWGVLEDAGIQVDPNVKHDVLSKVVIATGSDGYKATLSLGELHPNFGGPGEPHLLAYGWSGGDLGDNGFARIISPDDNARGRFVSNLISLEVVDAAPGALTLPGGTSDSFTLSGDVVTPGTITTAELATLGLITRDVTYLSGGSEVTRSFTGVGLGDFLDTRGVLTDPDIRNDILRKALPAFPAPG